MICYHVRATGAFDAGQGQSDLFNIHSHEDENQDFDTRWKLPLTASVKPTENVLEGLHKVKIVLAMYEQEIDRHQTIPSYQRLETMVRRHIDQMIGTRNFKARNDRIQTGVLVKSQTREKVRVERKVGE